MIKRGQCSNSPTKCSNAANGTLLAYAGPQSICPECGAPLALVADFNNDTAKEAPNPSRNFQNSRPNSKEYSAPEYEEESGGGVMGFIKVAGLMLLIAGGVFLGLKIFTEHQGQSAETQLPSNEVTAQPTTASAVQAISPSMFVKSTAILSILSAPSANGANLGQVAAGTPLEVNGRINIGGADWLRVVVPNQGGTMGYVHATDTVNMDGSVQVLPSDGTIAPMGNMVAVAPIAPKAPPVLGEVKPMPQTPFYVQGAVANIRQAAGISAARVGSAVFAEGLIADAERTVDGKSWYRVRSAGGVTGWVSAANVGKSKPEAPPESTTTNVNPTTNSTGDSTANTTASNGTTTNGTADSTKPSLSDVASIETDNSMVVSAESAAIRAKPDGETTKVADAQKGMVVKVSGKKSVNGVTWYHVTSKRFNIDGWVTASSLKSMD